MKDRHYPFGSDTEKNEKYARNKKGDDYGINTYWGIPDSKDDNRKILDKIQWLSNSYKQDVWWRRILIPSIILSIICIFVLDVKLLLKPYYIFVILFSIFISIHYSITYYNHHYLWRRTKFIDTHIRKLKENLGLPLYNRIAENPLIQDQR